MDRVEGPHIFSRLVQKPTDLATKSAIVEALRAIAEEAEVKRRFTSIDVFPEFLE